MSITASDMADLMAFDDLCARVYADKRMPPGTRELAVTLAWMALRDPERAAGESNTRRASRRLGATRTNESRLKTLFSEDAPRYERPQAWAGPCDGPRVRPYKPRGGSEYSRAAREQQHADNTRCGVSGVERVDEYDMVTGQIRRVWWFCSRHKADAERVRQQLAAKGTRPPPIPNRGGLIACYFEPAAVEECYRWARPWWEPPYHGICADDWPAPGYELVPKRPRLALVVGGLEA